MRFILLLVLILGALEAREPKKAFDSLASQTKKKIEFLFSHLVRYESLGFVLFGKTKAAAYCTLPIHCDYSIYPSSVTNNPLKYQNYLKQCWMVWIQHNHKFPHPNLIICEEYDDFCREGFFLQLFFINKKRLRKILDTYYDDFTEVLGKNFSPEKFIAWLEKKRKLRPLLKHDDKLLGLILGFGRESSTLFRDYDESMGDDVFQIIGYKPPGCLITPVSFKGNPNSQETRDLVNIYTQEIAQIDSIFKSESFFELFLTEFCKN